MGVMAVPLIVIGDTRLTGFNPAQIDAAIAAAS